MRGGVLAPPAITIPLLSTLAPPSSRNGVSVRRKHAVINEKGSRFNPPLFF